MKIVAFCLSVLTSSILNAQDLRAEYVSESFRFALDGPYEESIDSINHLMKREPTNRSLLYYRGVSHFAHGRVGDAYDDISLYLQKGATAERYYGHVLLGKILHLRLVTNLALAEFDKAIDLDASNALAYLEKAHSYAYAFNSEKLESLEFIDKAIKKFPGETEFNFYRGLLLTRANDYKKATIEFETYLKTKSPKREQQNGIAHLWVSKCYLKSKRTDQALEFANKGLVIYPEYYEGYGIRGEIFLALNQPATALKDFSKMEERFQSSYYSLIIAEAYEKSGDLSSACQRYQNLASQFPQQTKAKAKLKKLRCN